MGVARHSGPWLGHTGVRRASHRADAARTTVDGGEWYQESDNKSRNHHYQLPLAVPDLIPRTLVTTDDLCFSCTEIDRFFHGRLSRRERAVVTADSAGWPIALRIRYSVGEDVAGESGRMVLRSTAHAVRAFLFANATAARLPPRRCLHTNRPPTATVLVPPCPLQCRADTVDQQRAQIAVAMLADAEQLRPTTRRVLPRHQPQPGGHLATVAERRRVAEAQPSRRWPLSVRDNIVDGGQNPVRGAQDLHGLSTLLSIPTSITTTTLWTTSVSICRKARSRLPR